MLRCGSPALIALLLCHEGAGQALKALDSTFFIFHVGSFNILFFHGHIDCCRETTCGFVGRVWWKLFALGGVRRPYLKKLLLSLQITSCYHHGDACLEHGMPCQGLACACICPSPQLISTAPQRLVTCKYLLFT